MTRRPTALAGAALSLALLLSACGGGEDDPTLAQPDTAPSATATCEESEPTVAAPDGATTDLQTKPDVQVPEGPPPCGLVVSDIVEGDGAVAQPGDEISVQYVGVDYATGEQFDASWDRGGEPFTFTLGGGQVIQGWDEGLVGMKVGGRRQLVIPPDLAYGEQGAGGAIGPDATLVFVVDLLGIEGSEPAVPAPAAS